MFKQLLILLAICAGSVLCGYGGEGPPDYHAGEPMSYNAEAPVPSGYGAAPAAGQYESHGNYGAPHGGHIDQHQYSTVQETMEANNGLVRSRSGRFTERISKVNGQLVDMAKITARHAVNSYRETKPVRQGIRQELKSLVTTVKQDPRTRSFRDRSLNRIHSSKERLSQGWKDSQQRFRSSRQSSPSNDPQAAPTPYPVLVEQHYEPELGQQAVY